MDNNKVMNTQVLALTRAKYHTLSVSQQRVADYVLAHADRVMISSLSDLAAACQVSEPTVIRFLRKLGYESYQVFRVNIAQELAEGKSDNFYAEITETDNIEAVRDKVINLTARCLKDSAHIIDAGELEKLVDMLLMARRIFIIGMGASAAQAFDLYHKLHRLGLWADYCHDPHMINIVSTNLDQDCLLVAFSHSGESREILDGIRFSKQSGAKVAVITSYPNSSSAALADCTLLSSSQETLHRSDAMTSRIIQLAIIDMIYVAIALKTGKTAQDSINRTRVAVANNKT